METIYQDEFLIIKTIQDKFLLCWEWKPHSQFLPSIDVFFSLCEKILHAIIDTESKLLLENALHFNYPIEPEVQKKIVEQMMNKARTKVTHIAHVLAHEYVANLSQTQLWAENKSKAYEENFFSNVEDAEKWLLTDTTQPS